MAWLELAVLVFKFAFAVWDAIKERNEELRKKKTEALQSGLRGIVDRDPSRIVGAYDNLRRLRGL